MITKKDLMKLESLVYLLSISQDTSKKNVAENLGISIDTMNKYLNDLENSLGFKLLTSTNRGTVLTPSAREILPLADTLKSIIREMEFISKSNSEISGTVRISIHDGITATIFNEHVYELYEKYPGIKIETMINSPKGTNSALLDEADLALSYVPATHADDVICVSQEVTCGLFASSKYLGEFGIPYDLEDLLNNHRFCFNHNNIKYIRGLEDIYKKIKHTAYVSNSTYSTYLMVKGGAGIGIFPFDYKTPELTSISSIVSRDEVPLNYTLYLIARRNTKDIPRVRAVLDFLKSNIKKLS